jgi:RNA polymerase sigma-70 factor, ECF subfamily
VTPEDTTERLVLEWRAGRRDAGNLLLHRYRPKLQVFFGRRSREHADELVQRTLLACTESVARFEGRSTFRTYLYGIARNQYRMHLRAEAFARHEPVTIPTRAEEGPSQLAAVRQEHLLVLSALRQMPPHFAVPLKKYYWKEQPLDEIARELEISVGTVKSRLARGRAALKHALMKLTPRDDLRRSTLREVSNWFATRGATLGE